MQTALIIALSIILFVFVLLLIPIYVEFELEKIGTDKKTEITVKYLFLKITPGKKKKKEKKPEKPKNSEKDKKAALPKKSVGEWFATFKFIEDDLIDILQYAKKHAVSIKSFGFFMNFGMDNAMNTGIATGAAYGTVYNMVGFINRNIPVEKCEVKINPDFENTHLELNTKCIFRIKNAHIIVVAIKAIKIFFKIKKANEERKF